VVAADGRLGVPKSGPGGVTQRALLSGESAAFDPDGRIADFAARRIAVDTLPHGVSPRTRPAEAPASRRRKR
jgi:hypothetical protein